MEGGRGVSTQDGKIFRRVTEDWIQTAEKESWSEGRVGKLGSALHGGTDGEGRYGDCCNRLVLGKGRSSWC